MRRPQNLKNIFYSSRNFLLWILLECHWNVLLLAYNRCFHQFVALISSTNFSQFQLLKKKTISYWSKTFFSQFASNKYSFNFFVDLEFEIGENIEFVTAVQCIYITISQLSSQALQQVWKHGAFTIEWNSLICEKPIWRSKLTAHLRLQWQSLVLLSYYIEVQNNSLTQ